MEKYEKIDADRLTQIENRIQNKYEGVGKVVAHVDAEWLASQLRFVNGWLEEVLDECKTTQKSKEGIQIKEGAKCWCWFRKSDIETITSHIDKVHIITKTGTLHEFGRPFEIEECSLEEYLKGL